MLHHPEDELYVFQCFFFLIDNTVTSVSFVPAINFDFVRSVGQKFFVSFKERGSFSNAVQFCSQEGLELALPQNEEENTILTEVFGESGEMAWLDVNNNNSNNLIFTKWGEGHAYTSVQASHCTVLTESGIWRTTHDCFLSAYIVCQTS